MREKNLLLFTIIANLLCLFFSCNSDNKTWLFTDYNASDTSTNGGFYLERNDNFSHNGKEFYRFKFRLKNTYTELYGYLASMNDSLFLYYPEINEEYILGSFSNNNSQNCNSVAIGYNLTIDSIYKRREKFQVCNNGYLLNASDTIYKFAIAEFSLLKKGDNLGLYINRNKGIIGWTSQLSDGVIISYGGNIYDDTLNTIQHSKKIIL